MSSYDLFFDESGVFEELPIISEKEVRKRENQPWPSQLVGILAPAGQLNKKSADSILAGIFTNAGLALPNEVHANTISDPIIYHALLGDLLEQVSIKKWQVVRLINRENIGYGDRATTYTNLASELILRIFENLSKTHHERISLNVVGATVLLHVDEKHEPVFIKKEEYASKINEYLSFSAVRHGVAQHVHKWEISTFELRSGKYHRALQLCDLLSNGSYNDFRRCNHTLKSRFIHVLGNYNFSLFMTTSLETIDNYLSEGFMALALQSIAENIRRTDISPEFRDRLDLKHKESVEILFSLPSSARNIQLQLLTEWARQLLELRNLELAAQVISWMLANIAVPICNLSSDTSKDDLDWFPFSLAIHGLTLCNHQGNLREGKMFFDQLNTILPKLTDRWEHASLIMEAMVIQSVHLNDTFEFDEAAKRMMAVSGYYENLSALMTDALPGMFPGRVRSRHRGMALGTWLQSEMFAGLSDPSRLDHARQLNEMAIDEFVTEDDKNRQFQYRSQIETFAGNFEESLKYLARSLSCKASHPEVAGTISKLEGHTQGFAILHWTRIGTEAARCGDKNVLKCFLDAWNGSGLHISPWITADRIGYPAHGIRRQLAVLYSASGDYDAALSVLGLLRALDTSGEAALEIIKIAACAEVAAHIGDRKPVIVRKLVDSDDRNRLGVLQQCTQFRKSIALFKCFNDVIEQLEKTCRGFLNSNFASNADLLRSCRRIGD